MVLPGSRRVSRAPRYLGYRFESVELSLTWLSHSLALLSRRVQLAHGLVTLLTRPYNPERCTRNTFHRYPKFLRFHPNDTRNILFPLRPSEPSADHVSRAALGLGCSDFARRYFRNRCCFLFLQVLRWFTSLGSLLSAYVFSGGFSGFTGKGFPIRKSPDHCLLAAPRGLSQLATSFFACLRQGIHRTPLVA
jgi:hypothetical protein